jgi:GTP cyclohydrolase I
VKTDRKLGQEIKKYLKEKGVETPTVDVKLNNEEKIELISESMKTIVEVLGLDTTDDSISGTAERVAKMYVNELCFGLNYDRFPNCTVFENNGLC